MLKKIMFVSFFTVSAIFANDANLLSNPSFETLNAKGLPAAFSASKKLTLDEIHHIDKNGAVDGSNAALLVNTDSKLSLTNYLGYIQWGLQNKFKKIAPGTEMEFSVYVKTDSPSTKFFAYIEGIDNNGKSFLKKIPTVTLKQSNQWKQLRIEFKAPEAGVKNAYACFLITSTGKVWYDSAYLGSLEDAPEPEGK